MHKDLIERLNFEQVLEPTELIHELQQEIDEQVREYRQLNDEDYDRLFRIDFNGFSKTADIHDRDAKLYKNTQTTTFVEKFGL
ncbi:unnamed protein product [Ambrosiozyma monospora]|uniref:Unnamed protein product n=1 Tax=Ambrosiozyma monospora TaxID=43982 RepID=A0ACB5T8Q1_AMBMO|nr:unnamed protein product [Ambrosiozyma monospora]